MPAFVNYIDDLQFFSLQLILDLIKEKRNDEIVPAIDFARRCVSMKNVILNESLMSLDNQPLYLKMSVEHKDSLKKTVEEFFITQYPQYEELKNRILQQFELIWNNRLDKEKTVNTITDSKSSFKTDGNVIFPDFFKKKRCE